MSMTPPAPARRREPSRADPVEVYALLPLQYHYARAVLEGVGRYRPRHVRWRISPGDRSGLEAKLRVDPEIHVISMLTKEQINFPPTAKVVNVAESGHRPNVASVKVDNLQVGRLAAEHLLDLGYAHFYFAGKPLPYAEKRYQGFMERLAEDGAACTWLAAVEVGGLTEILPGLELPCAVFADSDEVGIRVREAARITGISVPGELSLLGTDNDRLLCTINRPYLSSVDTAGSQVGLEAARLLERMIVGSPPPQQPLLVPPGGIVLRESTAKRVIDDPLLARALRYIQDHATEGLTVEMVADAVNSSSRTLQRRYRKHFRESIKNEITRVRMDEAKRLLAETDMKIIDVALQCGFRHTGRFSGLFHRLVKKTPGEYRKANRMA